MYRGWPDDAYAFLVCHFNDLSCEIFWDTLRNDGNGANL